MDKFFLIPYSCAELKAAEVVSTFVHSSKPTPL